MHRIPNTTDVSQSKRLIAAGLPTATSDSVTAVSPAWTLSKLISLMPNDINYLVDKSIDITDEEAVMSDPSIQYDLRMNNNSVRYVTYSEEERFCAYGVTLIDAVVDAVIWLLDEGWIEKEVNLRGE